MAKQTFTTGQVLTAAQMTSLQQTAMGGGSTTAKTTSYVLVAADAGTVVQMNSASATTITVNTALFAAGDTVQIQNVGSGVCTVTAGTATVNTSSTLSLKQYDAGSLYFNTTSAAIFFASDAADGSSPLTTKGDLYTFSTVDARLAVGNNGETLVADSAATTGLRYQAPVAVNPIVNGGFDVWQRGTSFASGTRAYTADRFEFFRQTSAAGATLTRQTSGLTTIQYCARVSRDSGNTATNIIWLTNSIESANSFPYAGKTIVFSFYARAGANYSSASSILNFSVQSGTGTDQNINSTYTGAADVIASTNATLTTTWQRFTYTGTVGSTATELAYYFDYTPVGTAGAADYYEITGIQIEVGSVATPFKRSGGTIQGELAACQRYYWRRTGTQYLGTGSVNSSTQGDFMIQFATEMRTAPTMATNSGTSYFKVFAGNVDTTASTIGNFYTAGTLTVLGRITGSGLTTGQGCIGYINNASGYVEASAEL